MFGIYIDYTISAKLLWGATSLFLCLYIQCEKVLPCMVTKKMSLKFLILLDLCTEQLYAMIISFKFPMCILFKTNNDYLQLLILQCTWTNHTA